MRASEVSEPSEMVENSLFWAVKSAQYDSIVRSSEASEPG